MQVPRRLRLLLEDLLKISAGRYRATVQRLLEALAESGAPEQHDCTLR